jgi:acetylcholinesterase
LSDPIIAGLIQDSGTALLPQGIQDQVRSNFSLVAHHIGCSNLNTGSELACMKKVPFQTIEAFLKGYSDDGTQLALNFNPVVDNTTIFVNYTACALAGNFTKKPAIIGNNANEGRSLVACKSESYLYNHVRLKKHLISSGSSSGLCSCLGWTLS